MAQDLSGRTVVLIGGGSGIGFQVALAAAEAGASLVLGSRNLDKLSNAATQIEQQYPAVKVQYGAVDVEDEASIGRFISDIESIDHLLVTAANYVTGSLEELSLEQAASPFVSKFWGQYNAVRHARPKLSADASIVLMSGAAGARPPGAAPAYVACNSAIEGLGRGLAVELAPVRVNVVSPGTVEGNLWANRDQAVRDAAFESYRGATVLHSLPQERDVAEVVMMLFSNRAMTGATIFPDSGYTFH
ncbi:SDR family oxidoreductase [Psychromicrobium lacuslunae]|uniref:Short-chain dehydrogenase n=1 Tax=Psychromicrobium lacuslunae TaxID=1618207 RepID=A0A0D4C486_9MICC|nr:SDR family oxidoreductase [Psychromicrobium lacuslunae]AJT43190.1 short-chain dehydrogenase [Psychromicrobium lacuslunae]